MKVSNQARFAHGENNSTGIATLKTIMHVITFTGSVACVLALGGHQEADITAQSFLPAIPRLWDDEQMAVLELPLADPSVSPKLIPADYYYRIPIRPIYKSYPVYAPGKEPAGYREWLKKQEPETVFDVSRLKTQDEWIQAGGSFLMRPSSTTQWLKLLTSRTRCGTTRRERRLRKTGRCLIFITLSERREKSSWEPCRARCATRE